MHNSSGFRIACLLAGACVSLAAAAQTNHYVSPAGGNTSPYTNWAMAATTIQAAIDASGTNDVIWVTNGVKRGQVEKGSVLGFKYNTFEENFRVTSSVHGGRGRPPSKKMFHA